MHKFSCICQNYHGFLCVSASECYFTSSLFRMETKWENVRKIKLDTKQIKGVPTSVLVIHLIQLEGLDSDASSGERQASKKQSKSSSRKYFFHGFPDLLAAEERVKAYWEAARVQSEKAATAVGSNNKKNEDGNIVRSEGSAAKSDAAQRDDRSSVASSPAEQQRPSTGFLVTAKPHATESERRTTFASPKSLTASMPNRPLALHNSSTYCGNTQPQSWQRAAETISVYAVRTMSWSFAMASRGPIHTLVTFAILCLIVATGFQLSASVQSGPYSGTMGLVDHLESLKDYYRTLSHYSTSGDFDAFNAQKMDLMDSSRAWIQNLEQATLELVEKYVLLQVEMSDLRGRRAERLLQSPDVKDHWGSMDSPSSRRYFLADPSAEDNGGSAGATPKTKEEGKKKRSKTLSVKRMLKDIQYWQGKLSRMISFVKNFLRGENHLNHRTRRTESEEQQHATGNVDLLRYSEKFLEGFDLVQYVTREEKTERNECIRISKQMIKVTRVLEDLFMEFTSLLMTGMYERLASGAERPHYWSSPPSAILSNSVALTELLSSPLHPQFSSEEMVRIIFIRRFAAALVQLDPTEFSEEKRREDALLFLDNLLDFSKLELSLAAYKNRASKAALLQAFSDKVVHHNNTAGSTKGVESTLRNIVEEIKFWDTHEDLWMEHILVSLPAEQQQRLSEMYNTEEQEHDEIAKWKYLPVFKGLMCFSQRPVLETTQCKDRKNKTSQQNATNQVVNESNTTTNGTADALGQKNSSSDKSVGTNNGPIATNLTQPSAGFTVRNLDNNTTLNATYTPRAANASSSTSRNATLRKEGTPKGSRGPSNMANLTADLSKVFPYGEPKGPTPFSRAPHSPATVEDTYRVLYDPSRLENEVTVSKERWMNELGVFQAICADTLVSSSWRTSSRISHLAGDGTPAATVRARLFNIIHRANFLYVAPLFISDSGFWRWLWPGTWFEYLIRGTSGSSAMQEIHAIGRADPVVQMASVNIVQIPWGTHKDAPLTILKNIFLQPPDLLLMKLKCRSQLFYTWLLLLVGVVALSAALFFL